ncbi:uncharacterized protein LOC142973837 [Anticarsia gemmatalis]|uniref:uncharacterized protein LOC142973837 n=1 Tax=Anticarsia gemmatalis TaxID=129554 RepID=UPI003F75AA96
MRRCVLLIVLSLVAVSASQKPRQTGSCPETLPVDICGAACGPQIPCKDNKLCCPTACGRSMCVDPMTERHLVDYVRPGNCPKIPRGGWESGTHTCTSDSDCPWSLKCCTNNCGAQTCQRPETTLWRTRTYLGPRTPTERNVRPGSCPKIPRGGWESGTHTCTSDSDCPWSQKCCTNSCGALTCQRPETTLWQVGPRTPTARDERPGNCPKIPRSGWDSGTHNCTSDSDCPWSLKCCVNNCGAQTCQRPETTLWQEGPRTPTERDGNRCS